MLSTLVLAACTGSVPTPPPTTEVAAPAQEEAKAEAEPSTAEPAATTEAEATGFRLTSPDFPAGGGMPVVLTCEGEDRSPALAWHDAPEGTQSFALIVSDPDAPDPARPRMTWVHWVAYDLPAQTAALAAGAAANAMPEGAREGSNDFRTTGYGGPCPPVGEHRYFHNLYALDVVLGDLGPLARVPLGQAMEGHILGEAELIGTYQKTVTEPGTVRSGR